MISIFHTLGGIRDIDWCFDIHWHFLDLANLNVLNRKTGRQGCQIRPKRNNTRLRACEVVEITIGWAACWTSVT